MVGRDAAGGVVPRVEGDTVYFGNVPASFNPPIPPPSYLEGRRVILLVMNKTQKMALVRVLLKPLEDYLYAYLFKARSNVYRPLLNQKTIDKIEAMGRAAQEIKALT